jgi:hypothetical protein
MKSTMRTISIWIGWFVGILGCATGAIDAATEVDSQTSPGAKLDAGLPGKPGKGQDASVPSAPDASTLPVKDAAGTEDAKPPPPTSGCGEATCTTIVTRDIGSHFTGVGCTGTESYYTPYNSYDGIRRSWDGAGLAGTVLRTETNRSFKDASGVCMDAWPAGNTLSDFVRIYR